MQFIFYGCITSQTIRPRTNLGFECPRSGAAAPFTQIKVETLHQLDHKGSGGCERLTIVDNSLSLCCPDVMMAKDYCMALRVRRQTAGLEAEASGSRITRLWIAWLCKINGAFTIKKPDVRYTSIIHSSKSHVRSLIDAGSSNSRTTSSSCKIIRKFCSLQVAPEISVPTILIRPSPGRTL